MKNPSPQIRILEGPYLKNKFVKALAYESLAWKPSFRCTIVQMFTEKVMIYVDPNDLS